jgi:DNA polymerase III epsilon subunit-like protein
MKDKLKELLIEKKHNFFQISELLNQPYKEVKKYAEDSGLTAIPLQTMIEKLKGKSVVIFDLETSGLPQLKKFNTYFPYKENVYYNSSRIVQVAWCRIDSFLEITEDPIIVQSFYRKPSVGDPFDMNPKSIEIHKITSDFLQENGIELEEILYDYHFLKDLQECDYILSHNINFDRNILFNELYRLNYNRELEFLETHLKKFQCTCKATFFTKLSTLYESVCGQTERPMFHDAKEDVWSLLKILIQLDKNKDEFK